MVVPKNTKMKKILAILVLVTSGISSTAQDVFQKELFSADMVLKYRSEIGLSDQKVSKIKKIYSDHITEFNSIKWDLDAELVALNKHLALSDVNERSSLDQMEKVMNLEERLKRIRLRMLIKIKNELSEAQQKQLKNLRTENDMKGSGLTIPIDISPQLIIKGSGALTGDKPLFVIKDKKGERIVSDKVFKDLKTSNIESIHVIKGNQAIKLYGEDGKNGVVVVQIKK